MPNKKPSKNTPPAATVQAEDRYLAQLEQLYPNCPFRRALQMIADRGYKIGDLVKLAKQKKNIEVDPFDIVKLLRGELAYQQDGKPTHALQALAAALERPAKEFLQIAKQQNSNRQNYFEQKKHLTAVPNGGAFTDIGSMEVTNAVTSHFGEEGDGSLTGADISQKKQRAAWHLEGNHVIYRGAKGPNRGPKAKVHKPRDRLSELGKS